METLKRPRGRPPVAEEDKLLKFCIRVTKAQRAKIETGGLVWFRRLIDRAKLP